uniref:transferrin receptor protein 2 n=1 Tax=Myxine glutinosa TaxID=7769 RepID=UPI00358DFC03
MSSIGAWFSQSINGRTYSRFEPEAQPVELQQANEEAVDEGDHVGAMPTIRGRPSDRGRCMCSSSFLWLPITAGLCIFSIAFLSGYLVSRAGRAIPGGCNELASSPDLSEDEDGHLEVDPSPLTLSELWKSLEDSFDGKRMREFMLKFSAMKRTAGSPDSSSAAQMVFDQFQLCSLSSVKTDVHQVSLQEPDRNHPNVVQLLHPPGSVKDLSEDSNAFFAYSPSRNATGVLVYVNYGRLEDFEVLRTKLGSQLNGSIVLVRAGNISSAEKVANAEANGCVGVLVYPDPADFYGPMDTPPLPLNQTIGGHVHFGYGDPYTPGFPSFNNTPFPPVPSSGLPGIPAQPISGQAAQTIFRNLKGELVPATWQGGLNDVDYHFGSLLSPMAVQLRMSVNNRDVRKTLHNIMGVLQGHSEPDRYVMFGAQRDSTGPGIAESASGTALMLEVAMILSNLTKNGFQPRRSIIFLSWDGGEFGSVGATEWLEGYLSLLHRKAVAYISLDNPVTGDTVFNVQGSPLLGGVLHDVLHQVLAPGALTQTVLEHLENRDPDWRTTMYKEVSMQSSLYPFLAYAGIPSVGFGYVQERGRQYGRLGSPQDTWEALRGVTETRGALPTMCAVAEVAALLALNLAVPKALPLKAWEYVSTLGDYMQSVAQYTGKLRDSGITLQWVHSSLGDYTRAVETLEQQWQQSDINNEAIVITYNNRLLQVEKGLLSPFASPLLSPSRHLVFGQGEFTLSYLLRLLSQLSETPKASEVAALRGHLAFTTWTLRELSNSISGDVWDMNSSF